MTIFLTSFIAQFGKELTHWILKKFKKGKDKTENPIKTKEVNEEVNAKKTTNTKIEKKREKNKIKKLKKK